MAASDLSFGTWAPSLWHLDSLVVAYGLHCSETCGILSVVSWPGIEPCIARKILNHRTTRDVPSCLFIYIFLMVFLSVESRHSLLSLLFPFLPVLFVFLFFLLKDVQSDGLMDWWGREGKDGKFITFPLGFLENSWLLTKRVMIVCRHVWFYPQAQRVNVGNRKEVRSKGNGAAFKAFLLPRCPRTSEKEHCMIKGGLWAGVLSCLPPSVAQVGKTRRGLVIRSFAA